MKNLKLIIKIIVLLTIIEIICFSTAVLMLSRFEHLSFFNAYYLAAITVFTVGYGDLYPVTQGGRVAVIFLLFSGVGYISTLSSMITTLLVEGQVIRIWGDKLMMKKISRLRGHVIVCGLGRAGSSAVEQLRKEGLPFVGIDSSEIHCKQLEEQGDPVIMGDATEDSLLERAGIEYASSIISALPEDADNILITMAAKDLNKNIRVVSRSNRRENEKRLYRAGADWVITLGLTGGSRLAMAAVKPATVGFIQNLLDWSDHELRLEEFLITEESALTNRSVADSKLRELYGAQILALVRNEKTIANPDPAEQIINGDMIIAFGTQNGLNELAKQSGVACPLKIVKL